MTTEVSRKEEKVARVEDLPVYVPPADVYETPDHYAVLIDLPGVAESDLELSLEEGVLRISGVRREPHEAQGRLLVEEWEPCRYQRSFRLATDCDTGKIEATLRNGVLTVTIPKTETARPRKIPVKAE
ncbi:MAG: Hsp20/alpha crystallin family protein [Verrucomicrobia bacterium]|nr:MAG: Hsp20/alpha crystallin family protein [Verrucomicrobiota bacterium]